MIRPPRLPRLRDVLLLVLLSVLILPLGAVYFFRIFENELVRQTEQELIAQSAVLGATFRHLLRDTPGSEPVATPAEPQPLFPVVDLAHPLEPPRPDARPVLTQPDPRLTDAARIMTRIMRDTQPVTLAGMRLLDPNGVVLAGREEVGQSLAHVPEVRQALDGAYAAVIRQRVSDEPRPPIYSISRGTDIRVFTAFPVHEDGRLAGVLYLSRTPPSILKRLHDVRREVALACLTMLGVTVLLGLLVSSAIARPIRALLLQIERVRQGEARTVRPIAHPVTREVARLSESFAAMSEALAERGDYIRRFASHVSHEFKTPLTSMQGALELLRDHLDTMAPARAQAFLDNLLADTERMKRLVTRLLELARADALEPSQEHSTLSAVLRDVDSAFRDRGLRVLGTDQSEITIVPMAAETLAIVLANLAENSLRHGADHLTVVVADQNDGVSLVASDNGQGILPANRDKIFTPFFTTRRANGGTGLGLEICRSLLRAHGARIELDDPQPATGAAFRIAFPARSDETAAASP